MEDLQQEDVQIQDVSTSENIDKTEEVQTDSTQDILKTELDRVKKNERSELDKANFSLKKNADRVRELGGDPDEVLGKNVSEDDEPITVGMWKRMQAEQASKSALDLANEIASETERELVKYHLGNTIRSTGNPQEDLKLARSIVNSLKNSQVVEEIGRKPLAKSHSSGSGVDAKKSEEIVEYSPLELQMMRPPFNLSREDILKARKG